MCETEKARERINTFPGLAITYSDVAEHNVRDINKKSEPLANGPKARISHVWWTITDSNR